ncbi:hypothetical protein NBT05_10590 [Aquimarina sp. ERC-38]|uniref:M61 family metallopeptidase n=1 Tax=Aquimarina sp. ERC-38 TaxID=2949996 RepID=UPI0022478A24|nr:hypothetical protein [Aquimarina sp. ERC-38]UZO79413.1 hypothetical protein NBT05_10590 [Aquimarina sp. ERC-38]
MPEGYYLFLLKKIITNFSIHKIVSHFPFFLVVSILLFSISCGTLKEINKEDPIVTTYINLVNSTEDKIKVRIAVPQISTEEVIFKIPFLIPGTYQVQHFGTFLENLKALDINGNSLPVQKISKDEWKILKANQIRVITYEVEDTFDTAKNETIFSPTGTSFEKNQTYLLNLYACIGYVDNSENYRNVVTVTYPKFMKEGSSAEINKKTIEYENKKETTYSFDSYNEMVDNPIIVANSKLDTIKLSTLTATVQLHSDIKYQRLKSYIPTIERTLSVQQHFLSEFNIPQTYHLQLYLSNSSFTNGRGYGALEHRNTTTIVLPAAATEEKIKEELQSIISHEFFHTITPLQLHSDLLEGSGYNALLSSQHLWLYEGVTEYMAILSQIQGALLDTEEFYQIVTKKINIAQQYELDSSLVTISKHILETPYKKEYPNFYAKGCLVAMCLDLLIRDRTSGEKSLLDIIQILANKHQNQPFKEDHLFKELEKLTFPVITSFIKKHIINNEPIDYKSILQLVGLDLERKKVPASYFQYNTLSYIRKSSDDETLLFTMACLDNTFYKEQNILPGDILVSVNEKKYYAKDIIELIKTSRTWKEGHHVVFKIERNGIIKEKEVNMEQAFHIEKTIQLSDNLTVFKNKLRKKWLNN